MTSKNSEIAPPSEWQSFIALNPDIRGVDAFIVDANGNCLGKRLAADDAGKLFEEGVQFSACAPIACAGTPAASATIRSVSVPPTAIRTDRHCRSAVR